jgi:hypothetical protein
MHSAAVFGTRSQPNSRISAACGNACSNSRCIGIEMQDAALELVVVEGQFAPQGLQRGAAGQPEATMARMLARARAAVHWRRKRRPQAHCAGSARKRQSSGASSRPIQRSALSGACGLAQGSAWLTEIWPPLAKLVSCAGSRLALDHRHLMPVGGQIPGAGDADNAGAQHDHAHRISIRTFSARGLICPIWHGPIIVSAPEEP